MKKIFIVSQNFGTYYNTKLISAYDNKEAARKHIDHLEKIYNYSDSFFEIIEMEIHQELFVSDVD